MLELWGGGVVGVFWSGVLVGSDSEVAVVVLLLLLVLLLVVLVVIGGPENGSSLVLMC